MQKRHWSVRIFSWYTTTRVWTTSVFCYMVEHCTQIGLHKAGMAPLLGYAHAERDMSVWQVRDKLARENEQLRSRVELQGEQLSAMRAHIGVIRQHTITFILDQMDTLHMQRDTAVWPAGRSVGQLRQVRRWPDRPTDGWRSAPISVLLEYRADWCCHLHTVYFVTPKCFLLIDSSYENRIEWLVCVETLGNRSRYIVERYM